MKPVEERDAQELRPTLLTTSLRWHKGHAATAMRVSLVWCFGTFNASFGCARSVETALGDPALRELTSTSSDWFKFGGYHLHTPWVFYGDIIFDKYFRVLASDVTKARRFQVNCNV